MGLPGATTQGYVRGYNNDRVGTRRTRPLPRARRLGSVGRAAGGTRRWVGAVRVRSAPDLCPAGAPRAAAPIRANRGQRGGAAEVREGVRSPRLARTDLG